MDTNDFQQTFFSNLKPMSGLKNIFDYLPDVYFWMKDKEGKYIALNQADVKKLDGIHENDFIGKTDLDIFPRKIAESFMRDDRKVIETGNPVINRIELVPNEDASISWNSTTKVPLYSKDGKIYGTAGFSRDIKDIAGLPRLYSEMADVIEYISKNYMNVIKVPVLADLAFTSVGNFNRKFKKNLGISPIEFILKVRVKAACKHLLVSMDSLSDISHRVGFGEQSYFTRQFKNQMGVSPSNYRKNYLKKDPESGIR